MTETRKAIIELIEPYMDKTLSQGCLVKSHKGIGNFIYLNNFNEIEYISYEKHFCVEYYKCEVIGHYDITAVLKYIFIEGISKYKLRDPMFDNANIHCEWVGLYWNTQFIIPNKPLHLYTEEEEKKLLVLLVKLK